MSSNFVVTSALCIIPPSNVWDGIQKIRKVHDKSYERWPPHINIIYPFIHNNELPKFVNQIRDCLIDVKPFMVNMKEFKHFTHKSYNTIWLHPEQDDNIKEVQKILAEKFKDPKKTKSFPFCPHLSVGQASASETYKKIEMFSKDFDEICFEVNSVQIITRNGNKPFEVRYTIPFGGGDVISENVTVFPVK